jgi:glucose-1-phosphate thymidylyltransferase
LRSRPIKTEIGLISYYDLNLPTEVSKTYKLLLSLTNVEKIANHSDSEIFGLIPAGGKAERISPLPCSKEIYPIGLSDDGKGEELKPKAVCHYLLERMRKANIKMAYLIIREGKWDIPASLGDGSFLNMNLAYLLMGLPYGVPFTLDQAYPFVKNGKIVLGFPDIIFQPDDAFSRLLNHQIDTNSDIVLGLFPTDEPAKCDMVDLDGSGRVSQIIIKPSSTNLVYSWIIAVWTPVFTSFMHEYLVQIVDEKEAKGGILKEIFVGEVIQAAIQNNLSVGTVTFKNGAFWDIGTPDGLLRATTEFKIRIFEKDDNNR